MGRSVIAAGAVDVLAATSGDDKPRPPHLALGSRLTPARGLARRARTTSAVAEQNRDVLSCEVGANHCDNVRAVVLRSAALVRVMVLPLWVQVPFRGPLEVIALYVPPTGPG